MKYEPIFGDQSLFRFGPQNAVSARYGKDVHGNDNYIFDSGEIKATTGQLRDTPVIAMRRIIQEPKRWTMEDKKAGRLPEVLGKVTTYDGKPYSFVGESCHDNQWSIKDDSTGKVYHTPTGDILPIETPEEKAQREEDEFVKENTPKDMLTVNITAIDAINIYKQGVRAAYRKLKGGDK